MKKIGMLVAGAFALALAGCGDDGNSQSNDPASSSDEIEIEGTWTASADGMVFGEEEISSTSWAGSEVTAFDNGDNVAITRNADDAEFDPGKFNRNVWTEPEGGGFYYCTDVFGLDSEDAALSAQAAADDGDPATGGCGTGDFYWTRLDAAE